MSTPRSVAIGGTIALGWLGAAGCPVSETYLCADDDACTRSTSEGRCEATGYCSFPDATCPSGRRYGHLASPALASGCVDTGSTPGFPGGPRDTGGGAGATTQSGPPTSSTGSDPPDPAASAGSTTSRATSGSSTDGTSTAGSTGSSSLDSDGTPAGDPYGPCFNDADCPTPHARCLRADDESHCSPRCTTATDCPDSMGGTARVACMQEIGGRCVLDCAVGDCPVGQDCSLGFDQTRVCVWHE